MHGVPYHLGYRLNHPIALEGALKLKKITYAHCEGILLGVEFIIDLLAQGWIEAEILCNHPGLKHEDVQACLSYASAALRAEKVYPLAAA